MHVLLILLRVTICMTNGGAALGQIKAIGKEIACKLHHKSELTCL